MYNNIGAKIKVLAQVIAWLGIISGVIAGAVIMSESVGVGFGVMIGGALMSWISSWFMYGFGELIEQTTRIAKNTSFDDSGQKKHFAIACKCGTRNEEGMSFCQNCGEPINTV
ncbi:MAG: zinc ribbon domain-containing protein [Oscillospiraceae bacterium]|jgi:hypothetical protein|nr:zinc ribbon domain-containing protein [Oscillospiraceae bacterium]